MSERYSKLFSLEERLYCPGAPLIICAARLMRDGYSGKLVAQIKLKNISEKLIKAVKICITPSDSAGRAVKPVYYTYKDINAKRDDEIGQKTAVVLPDSDIISFELSVSEVVFDDGSCWSCDGSLWEKLTTQKTLIEYLNDDELATQYQVRYGSSCKYQLTEDKGLWFCTCGAINNDDERSCHSCRRVRSALKDVNISSLKAECEQRLKYEKELDENAETDKKRSKRKTLSLVLIPLLAVIILVSVFVPGMLKHKNSNVPVTVSESGVNAEADLEQDENAAPYQEALEIMRHAETKNPVGLKLIGVSQSSLKEDDELSLILYEAAAERFTALGEYKDSAKLAEDCLGAMDAVKEQIAEEKYNSAKLLLKEGSYCLAKEEFSKLSKYKDSALMSKEAIYQKALALYGFMSQRNTLEVYAAFSTDSEIPGKISFSKDFALKNGEGYITEFKAACGKDKVDFVLEDEPSEGLVPFNEALISLFDSLGSYKESTDYIEQLSKPVDTTHEFFELVQSGDLYAASDWLEAYEGDFENREHWTGLLNSYKPYCSSWVLNSGDSSLVPYIAGNSNNGTNTCMSFTSSVSLGEDTAVLKIISDDENYSLEFSCNLGSTGGFNFGDGSFNYFAYISEFDRIAIIKYNSTGKALSSCDYSRS